MKNLKKEKRTEKRELIDEAIAKVKRLIDEDADVILTKPDKCTDVFDIVVNLVDVTNFKEDTVFFFEDNLHTHRYCLDAIELALNPKIITQFNCDIYQDANQLFDEYHNKLQTEVLKKLMELPRYEILYKNDTIYILDSNLPQSLKERHKYFTVFTKTELRQLLKILEIM